MFQAFLLRNLTSPIRHPSCKTSISFLWRPIPRCLSVPRRSLATKKIHPEPSKPPTASKRSSKFIIPGTLRNPKTVQDYTNYADVLLRSKEPTILYQITKRSLYGPTAYSLVLFMSTIGCWFGYLGYFADDVPGYWTKVMSRIAGIILAAAATWTFLTTTRRIRTITAMPSNGKLLLRLEYAPAFPIPLRRPIVMTVPSKDITLRTRLADPRFTKSVDAKPSEKPAASKSKSLLSIVRAKLSAVAVKFSKAWFAIFINTRRVWTQEGFIPFKIAGKNGVWKLDIVEGMFKDQGKPLDRVVSYDFAY